MALHSVEQLLHRVHPRVVLRQKNKIDTQLRSNDLDRLTFVDASIVGHHQDLPVGSGGILS